MVTITGYQQRKNAEGKSFIVLDLAGELQVLSSQATGKPYVSILKCTMPCTFNEEVAQNLVGTTLPGSIEKTPCEPYDFTNPTTGESSTLDYRYSYQAPANTFKQNGTVPQLKMNQIEVL